MLVSWKTYACWFFSQNWSLPAYCDCSCPSPQLMPKTVTPNITNGDVTFPHSPSHLNCPFPIVSSEELVLSCLISFELSTFTFMVKAIYNCCKSVVWKTFPAVPVDTFYRTLTISFLTVLLLSLYAILSLAQVLVPQRVVKVFGLCFSFSRKGLNGTTPLDQSTWKIKTMRYALRLLKITRLLFRIWRNLLFCSNSFSLNMSIVLIRKLSLCI